MLVGGWRALRQIDLKLLLAYGTVSQLGFLLVVCRIGSRTAALAGLAMLLAHALFKADAVPRRRRRRPATGTRDLRELSGVGRRLPVRRGHRPRVAAASMAGLPAAARLRRQGDAVHRPAGAARRTPGVPAGGRSLVLAGLVVGSALTAGYTARFWWGAFATKPGVAADRGAARSRAPFLVSPVVLARSAVGLGFAGAAR